MKSAMEKFRPQAHRSRADNAKSTSHRSVYGQLLGSAIKRRFSVTRPAYVSEDGMLTVDHNNHKTKVPVRAINSISFSNAPQRDQVDMVAFIEREPGVRVYEPRYLGTMDAKKEVFSKTESLVRQLGIGVARLMLTVAVR